MESDIIRIKGAREHNLKNISAEIPRGKLTVITGLSGSGKSSLAFDTLYAEGQRRYVESLSAYARQFLGLMEKPDVDYIEGLSPAVSIEQKTTHKNPRSTVGTVTEIYDYFRLLFARAGTPYCHNCGKIISRQTPQQIVDELLTLPEKTRLQILSPAVRGKKGEHKELLKRIIREGFIRVRIDGNVKNVEEETDLDRKKKHNIEIVVDRIVIKQGVQKRLTDSVTTALRFGNGLLIADIHEKEERIFSENFSCPDCGISYGEISPRSFSFNTPYGACPECHGLGTSMDISPDLVVPDPELTLNEGAIAAFGKPRGSWFSAIFKALAEHSGCDLNTPWKNLTKKQKDIFLYGTGRTSLQFEYKSQNFKGETRRSFEGVVNNLKRRYKQTKSTGMREWISGFMMNSPCPECGGARLKRESLAVKVNGISISELTSYNIVKCIDFFNSLNLSGSEKKIASQIIKEIKERLLFLNDVGIGYLTLDRSAGTLSGGEAQRIRLATQIGSQLVGVLYILDEPSIGLHQKDNRKLLKSLMRLRDLGNTVVVVEHDEETIRSADYLIDMGPGAGNTGGKVVFQGKTKNILKTKDSLTSDYLTGRKKIEIPEKRRAGNGKFLRITGMSGNNLKDVSADIPLGKFICVTGVSGSGKSTFINYTLLRALNKHFNSSRIQPENYKKLSGLEHLDKIVSIDQSPIGRTPRSNPATYTKVFDPVRDLFAELPDSKVRGFKKGHFSFNVKGGRCESCEGAGIKRIEMHFLPDIYVKCDECKGKRYNRDVLDIRFKGKNISDILDMTVTEAVGFFKNHNTILRRLETLKKVGLGYIHLGQQATTLSGGEAQRIKLSSELSKKSTGKTLYILDEPTTGLHFDDVRMLLSVLHSFADGGNSVIVIEHNMDVIKTADHIIDLGPEGGDAGGNIIASGTPEQIASVKKSYTGEFLKVILNVTGE
ncbi:MAG: excinuclease ABC subunit UvrA [Fibrobacterota bacterium]